MICLSIVSLLVLFSLCYRIVQMPTQADVDAAVAAVATLVDQGFTDLTTTIQDETAKVTAAVAASGQVPQATLDQITALGTKFQAGIDAAKAAVLAELP